MGKLFRDRVDAGEQLAHTLRAYAGRHDVVVLALPRGGVPVAYEVAKALRAPLDVLVVRKLGAPGNPEFAMGAIAMGGGQCLKDSVLRALHVTDQRLATTIEREQAELKRRESIYRGSRPALSVEGRTVIVVDDGIATGASMRVALEAVRSAKPAHIVVAVPVSPLGSDSEFTDVADDFVCVLQPDWLMGIGQFYANFEQTSDAQVRALLDASRQWLTASTQDQPIPDRSGQGMPAAGHDR